MGEVGSESLIVSLDDPMYILVMLSALLSHSPSSTQVIAHDGVPHQSQWHIIRKAGGEIANQLQVYACWVLAMMGCSAKSRETPDAGML